MSADPQPPPRESPETAGYIVHDPRRVVSTLETVAFPVKRRTGYMARVALYGEREPGAAPIP
jgi:hypothetical protein